MKKYVVDKREFSISIDNKNDKIDIVCKDYDMCKKYKCEIESKEHLSYKMINNVNTLYMFLMDCFEKRKYIIIINSCAIELWVRIDGEYNLEEYRYYLNEEEISREEQLEMKIEKLSDIVEKLKDKVENVEMINEKLEIQIENQRNDVETLTCYYRNSNKKLEELNEEYRNQESIRMKKIDELHNCLIESTEKLKKEWIKIDKYNDEKNKLEKDKIIKLEEECRKELNKKMDKIEERLVCNFIRIETKLEERISRDEKGESEKIIYYYRICDENIDELKERLDKYDEQLKNKESESQTRLLKLEEEMRKRVEMEERNKKIVDKNGYLENELKGRVIKLEEELLNLGGNVVQIKSKLEEQINTKLLKERNEMEKEINIRKIDDAIKQIDDAVKQIKEKQQN